MVELSKQGLNDHNLMNRNVIVLVVIVLALVFLMLASVVIFWPKECNENHPALPPEMKTPDGVLDSSCTCIGHYKRLTVGVPPPGDGYEGLCYGIPVNYCEGYVDGNYQIVRCN